ncbi:hypothetical protein BJ742DRAFT_805368 [Cladochytrium replicatum]|nr:hypothetical protein BJ742DRAFT_805368 [Cladochytrium replicatum]
MERRDKYGFKMNFKHVSKEVWEQVDATYQATRVDNQTAWDKLMAKHAHQMPNKSERVKRLVRKGVPNCYRAQAWFKYSGAEELMRKYPKFYSLLTKLEEHDLMNGMTKDKNKVMEFIEIIERDLHRTFPDNIKFQLKKAPVLPPAAESGSIPRDQFQNLSLSSDDEETIDEEPRIPRKISRKSSWATTVSASSSLWRLDTPFFGSAHPVPVNLRPSPKELEEPVMAENMYIKSLRRILVAYAYYSTPHPAIHDLLASVAATYLMAASMDVNDMASAAAAQRISKMQDLPRRAKYDIGYCQSMNFVAGMLLLMYSTQFEPDKIWNPWNPREGPAPSINHVEQQTGFDLSGEVPVDGQQVDPLFFEHLPDVKRREIEERVFWTMVAIIEDLMPPEMYGSTLEGAQVEQEVLWHWILGQKGDKFGVDKVAKWVDALERGDEDGPAKKGQQSPLGVSLTKRGFHSRKRSKHLGSGGSSGMPPLMMVTTQWFMTIFVNVLPVETALRVWDCFLFQGEKILMRVALTLLKLHEKDILNYDDPIEAWKFIKEMPQKVIDCQSFIDMCFRPRHVNPFIMSAPTTPTYATGSLDTLFARATEGAAPRNQKSATSLSDIRTVSEPAEERIASAKQPALVPLTNTDAPKRITSPKPVSLVINTKGIDRSDVLEDVSSDYDSSAGPFSPLTPHMDVSRHGSHDNYRLAERATIKSAVVQGYNPPGSPMSAALRKRGLSTPTSSSPSTAVSSRPPKSPPPVPGRIIRSRRASVVLVRRRSLDGTPTSGAIGVVMPTSETRSDHQQLQSTPEELIPYEGTAEREGATSSPSVFPMPEVSSVERITAYREGSAAVSAYFVRRGVGSVSKRMIDRYREVVVKERKKRLTAAVNARG